MAKKAILIIVALLVISLIACAQPAPTPAPAPVPTPAPAPAPAPAPTVFKMVSFEARGSPQVEALMAIWMNNVAEISNGAVEIDWIGGPEVIPRQEIGEATRTGAIDVTLTPSGWMRSHVPAANFLNFSRVTYSVSHERGFDGWARDLFAEQMGTLWIGRGAWDQPYYLGATFPISTIADLEGHIAACPPSLEVFAEAMGMVVADIEEEFTAMEQGVLEAVITPAYPQYVDGLMELETHWVNHGILDSSLVLIGNLEKNNSLPANLQDVLSDAMAESIPAMTTENRKWNDLGLQKAEEMGLTIVTLSPKDLEEYNDAAFELIWEVKGDEVLTPEIIAKLKGFLAE